MLSPPSLSQFAAVNKANPLCFPPCFRHHIWVITGWQFGRGCCSGGGSDDDDDDDDG